MSIFKRRCSSLSHTFGRFLWQPIPDGNLPREIWHLGWLNPAFDWASGLHRSRILDGFAG